MKIIVAEKISASAVAQLQEPGWTVLTADQLEGKLEEHLETADALIVRSAVQADAKLLEHAKKLRVIGRAGVGVDNIDLEAATHKGIAVMNTPGANAVAVAEQTLGMMLAMARHLSRADALMHAGKWEKKSLQGTELRAKTLGIIGLGRIGMEVARRARAFGMELVAHDPFVSVAVAKEQGIRLAGLDELYAAADYITLHVGLTPQTTGMINEASIAKMKKGVRLVNCARGELVNEADLAQASRRSRWRRRRSMFLREEPPKNSPLLALDNVLLTPHVGGSTFEAQEAVGVQIAQQVKEYLKHGVIQNAVNVPSVSAEEYATMQPYIVLAERMGAFLAQVSEGSIEEISIRYSGHIAEWKTELIRNAAIKGILNQALEEKANLVNAATIADARGLRVLESHKAKASTGGAGSVLSIFLKSSDGRAHGQGRSAAWRCAAAAACGWHRRGSSAGAQPDLSAEPRRAGRDWQSGHDSGRGVDQHCRLLAGTARAEKDGAEKDSEQPREAIAVVHVDGRVSEEVLTKLRTIPAVQKAKAVRLF